MNKTLYTRDSLGNIRVWSMEQQFDQYRTISGLLNGEKVISEWTTAEAKNSGKKNATTAEEQAELEILAKYKKQLKTGYFEDIKDVDAFQYVEPMLAKLYKDYSKNIDLTKKEWIVQNKYNGMRCVATKNGLFTRKGEKYESVPHIEASLYGFFANHPEAILDGELFNNDLRQQLNEISKLIRKTVHISAEDLTNSEKYVKFYVYDGYGFGGWNKDHPYHVRKKWIDGNLIGFYDYIEQVKDYHPQSTEELNTIYQSFIDDGQEGGILRNLNAGYENKRSKNLLKIKPEDDDEAIILDIKEGNGNWAKTGKIITLLWNEKVFDATFKGTQEQGRDFLVNKWNWIGKRVTFLYNGLTGLGTPSFARVDINNCLKD